MGTRAPRPVVRKAKALAQAVQPVHVAARVDGFLEVLADPPQRRPRREPVREKVERRLKQLHPMD